jgi:hypothetical protein
MLTGSWSTGQEASSSSSFERQVWSFLSDQPVWYLHPENDEQRIYYGDWVIGRAGPDPINNEVPEFGLVFPDAADPRALVFFRLVDGKYQELVVSPGGVVESATVPGLAFRVRPQSEWTDGQKLDVLYRGELRPTLAGERDARSKSGSVRSKSGSVRSKSESARSV